MAIVDHALLALSALALNAALGGPRSIYRQFGLVAFAGRITQWMRTLERKLDREHRAVAERHARGIVVTASLAGAAAVAGLILGWIFQSNLRFAEIILLALLLPVRASWDIASEVKNALAKGDITAARMAFDGTALRHHMLLDEHGVARAAIEMLAISAMEKILSPVLWYVLLGLPGLLACKAVTMLHEAIGGVAGEDEGFAAPVRTAHRLLHMIPVRIAMLLWVLASAFLPSGKVKAVYERIFAHMAGKTTQQLSLLGMAGALNLSLGGPVSPYSDGEWIGAGSPKPDASDIKRGLYLFALFHLFLLLLLGLFL